MTGAILIASGRVPTVMQTGMGDEFMAMIYKITVQLFIMLVAESYDRRLSGARLSRRCNLKQLN